VNVPAIPEPDTGYPDEPDTRDEADERIDRKTILYPAMKTAGIPRIGPTGTMRTFHSFRHTFAKVALENGRPLAWVSRHLGHSGIAITDRVYGHFERAAQKREIEALAGAFSV
jgi:integrase